MKVSIIIPVYNVEQYIADCIQSVMRQTFQGPMECILVDDCGIDNSIAIAKNLIADYNGSFVFRVLHHERNRGLSAARNTGTEAASGEYVYYLDSDDAISSDCIESMYKVVLNHPGVEVVQGAVESIPYNKYYDLQLYNVPRYVCNNDWVRFNYFKCGESLPVNATNKLLKRSFLIENALAFKEGIVNEDELWSFVMYKRVKFWAVIGRKTYLRYYRPSSIMDTLNNQKQKRGSNMGIVVSEALKTIDKPFRDLQVYKCWDSFAQFVFPYAIDRNMVKQLYFRFLVCLLRIGRIKLAFRLAIGFFNKAKRRRLFDEIMPRVYRETSDKYGRFFVSAPEELKTY